MDFTSLFVKLLELSPFVASLFYFLFTIWKSMQAKDAVLMTTMKEHSVAMLVMQKESIAAQNNSADSNRQLSGSIDKLREHLCDSQDETLKEVRELKTKLNGRNRPAILTDPKSATA